MTVPVKSRDEWRDTWLMFYETAHHEPDGTPIPVDIGQDSYPWARASCMADVLAIQSAAAQAIAGQIPIDGMTEAQLEAAYGTICPRNQASKSSGYITIECGSSGTTINAGDELSFQNSNVYRHTGSTTLYTNGTQVPVESVDLGIGQNLESGSVLNWAVQRAGCYATCTVFEMPDGAGLSGGREQESTEEWKERIRDTLANPVGHGNEGDLLELIQESSAAHGRPGHGVPVEKGFVWPAIMGPGTYGYCFTVKRDNYWDSRMPSAGQLSTVLAYVTTYMPSSDMCWPSIGVEQNATLDISVSLNLDATQWADFSPWPTYAARSSGHKVVAVVANSSPTFFRIATDDGDYTGEVAPVAGNTLAVYDAANGVFRRKKVLSVSGTGPWNITCDATANQSDTTYTPVVGHSVSPWFDAINDVAEAVGTKMAGLGYGESSYDPGDGKRMVRIPRPTPTEWPMAATARIAYDAVLSVTALADATFLATSPSAPIASGAVLSYLLKLHDFAIFKS